MALKKPKLPTITIDGKVIEAVPDVVDVDSVKLDPDNPRIRYLVKSHGLKNPTEDQLKDLLWEIGGVQNLLQRIRNNKGAIDAILIKSDGTVVEGNCRLACYRHLKWKKIHAQRLPTVSQKEIDILLSKYHVSGKISWRSYAQAGQIYKLKHDHKMSEADIAKITGITVKDVENLLETYSIMTKKVLPAIPGKKGLKKFSYVYELVKNPALEKFRGKETNVDEFVGWVSSGKLRKGEHVRALPDILKKPEALKALRTDKHGGKKAVGMVVRPKEFELLEDVLKALGKMEQPLVDALKTDKKERDVLKQLHAKIGEVAEIAGVDLD